MRNLTAHEVESVSAAGAVEVLTDVGIGAGAAAGLGLVLGVFAKVPAGGSRLGLMLETAVAGAVAGAVGSLTVSLLHEYDVI